MHWIYILQCEDDIIYVGETTRLFKRIKQHITGNGGDNTSTWQPESLVALYKVPNVQNFINYNKNVINALGDGDYDKWLLYNFEEYPVFYDEEEDKEIVDCDNLECENNIVECLMVNNKENWNKFRGGKYVKFNSNNTKCPVNEYIKELPLCDCGLPCDIKKNNEKNYLYFRCAKKNIWDGLTDYLEEFEDYGFSVENDACKFYQEYKKDKFLRSNNYDKTLNEYNKLKNSMWLRKIENTEEYEPMECIGGCKKGLYYSKIKYKDTELFLCYDCFVNNQEELKDKYDDKMEIWIKNIPTLSKKIGSPTWLQEAPCIHCGRRAYSPVFFLGPLQLCKLCLGNHSNELKEKFSKATSWF